MPCIDLTDGNGDFPMARAGLGTKAAPAYLRKESASLLLPKVSECVRPKAPPSHAKKLNDISHRRSLSALLLTRGESQPRSSKSAASHFFAKTPPGEAFFLCNMMV